MDGIGVDIVIPARDEPECIGAVLGEVPPWSVDRVYVVVGERVAGDRTAEIAAANGATPVARSGAGMAPPAGPGRGRR